MKKIMKVLRALLYILLIILACLGVGLSGGVPLPNLRAKRDPHKDKIELYEKKKETKDTEIKE